VVSPELYEGLDRRERGGVRFPLLRRCPGKDMTHIRPSFVWPLGNVKVQRRREGGTGRSTVPQGAEGARCPSTPSYGRKRSSCQGLKEEGKEGVNDSEDPRSEDSFPRPIPSVGQEVPRTPLKEKESKTPSLYYRNKTLVEGPKGRRKTRAEGSIRLSPERARTLA